MTEQHWFLLDCHHKKSKRVKIIRRRSCQETRNRINLLSPINNLRILQITCINYAAFPMRAGAKRVEVSHGVCNNCHPVRGQSPKVCAPYFKLFNNIAQSLSRSYCHPEPRRRVPLGMR